MENEGSYKVSAVSPEVDRLSGSKSKHRIAYGSATRHKDKQEDRTKDTGHRDRQEDTTCSNTEDDFGIECAPVDYDESISLYLFTEAGRFKLACHKCVTTVKRNDMNDYYYVDPYTKGHVCSQNMVLVQSLVSGRHQEWIWIRGSHDSKKNHPKRKYALCYTVSSHVGCPQGMECMFAHSYQELTIWKAEKTKQFSMANLIKENQVRGERVEVLPPSMYWEQDMFRLTCAECMQAVIDYTMHTYYHILFVKHTCRQEFLVIKSPVYEHLWVWIRKQVESKTKTKPYNSVCVRYSSGLKCKVSCVFPHSNEEFNIWNSVWLKKFNMERFIDQNRKLHQGDELFSSDDNYSKHLAILYADTLSHLPFSVSKDHVFCFACSGCITPAKVINHGDVLYVIKPPKVHRCYDNKFLFIQAVRTRLWKWIRPTGRHTIRCRYTKSGYKCEASNTCQYAHSKEEEIIWQTEELRGFDLALFIQQNDASSESVQERRSQELKSSPGSDGVQAGGASCSVRHAPPLRESQEKHASPLGTNQQKHAPPLGASQASPLRASQGKHVSPLRASQQKQAPPLGAYMKFVCQECFLCKTCRYRGFDMCQMRKKGYYCHARQCLTHHRASPKIVLLCQGNNKPVHIHQLPSDAMASPDMFECTLCPNAPKCQAQNCQWAHNVQEAKIWKWQLKNKGKTEILSTSRFTYT